MDATCEHTSLLTSAPVAETETPETDTVAVIRCLSRLAFNGGCGGSKGGVADFVGVGTGATTSGGGLATTGGGGSNVDVATAVTTMFVNVIPGGKTCGFEATSVCANACVNEVVSDVFVCTA